MLMTGLRAVRYSFGASGPLKELMLPRDKSGISGLLLELPTKLFAAGFPTAFYLDLYWTTGSLTTIIFLWLLL